MSPATQPERALLPRQRTRWRLSAKRAPPGAIYSDSNEQITSFVRAKSEKLPCSVCSKEIRVGGSVLMFTTAVSTIRPACTTFTPEVGEISLNGAPEKEKVSVAILPSTVRESSCSPDT